MRYLKSKLQELQIKLIFLPTQLCKLQFHQIYVCFCSFSNTNIFNVSFSSSLIRLNTLSPYQKFVQIGNVQNLGSSFIQQSCVVEINTAPQHTYLRFIARFLQILVQQQMSGKFSVKTFINFDHTLLLSFVDQ